MKILGIETSCDETAVAVVEDGRRVFSNVIASQIDLHTKTGGVVPEVAAREHVLKMLPVLDEALEEAGCKWEDIDAVAVTKGPGLVSSLIIGTETASVISYVKDLPLIPVHHIAGHIYGNWLVQGEVEPVEIVFPVLVLTVSGGHNELVLMRGHGEFEVLGETRDDAAGEAFDKVSRLLGLGYPGGPAIAKLALEGDREAIALPRPMIDDGSLDFSFSGLKTAVLDRVKVEKEISEEFKADMAASFQEAVCDVLSAKLIKGLEKYPEVKEVHMAGGVSANLRLRELIGERLEGRGVTFRHPQSIRFCTDNAAMIAGAGYFVYQKNPDKYLAKTNVVPEVGFSF